MIYLNTIKSPLFLPQQLIIRDKEVVKEHLSKWRYGFYKALFIEKEYRYGVVVYTRNSLSDNIFTMSYGKNLRDNLLLHTSEVNHDTQLVVPSTSKLVVKVGYFDANLKFYDSELYHRKDDRYVYDERVSFDGVSWMHSADVNKTIDMGIHTGCDLLFIPNPSIRKFTQAILLKT